ncbi:DoxX family protein [Nocardia sp. CDC160]|uniref:DoxX family protein n=1 Tax=Nocardia sp. CDC160 TaxID=3112166 RepID=UPI002DB62B8B|nr:DoxX family protein [Nocardia sp. CDC160]MEC3916474.1 DoxX family protein [Nocardia sp. CDC160]
MVAELVAEVRVEEPEPSAVERWNPLARIIFRYGFVVLGVGMAGVLVFHSLLRSLQVPESTVETMSKWTSLHPLTEWVGEHVFDTKVQWLFAGSSDTQANWISTFTLLLVAVPVTVVWSLLDRGRPNYARLYGWFRLTLRFALVSALLMYGMIKVLPSQMAFSLERLVEPFGDMSPMAVLWSSTAASEPYEIALGTAEIVAALLLILPITAGLGAVLSVIVCLQVFLLNLTYDVPVKLLALQLLVYALVLAAPDIIRIVRALTVGAVSPRTPEPLVTTPRARRILVWGQVIAGVWLLITTVMEGHDAWQLYGNGRPHSPLYGIWNVTEQTSNGQPVAAADRFRRLIFDLPQAVTAQRPDDSLQDLPAVIDTERGTVTITKDLDHVWKLATLNYQQPQPDQLILDGQFSGRPVRLVLSRVDLDSFRQLSRGFHWTQPAPYLR